MLVHFEIGHIIFFILFNILFQGKIDVGKTPRSISQREVRLRSVLVRSRIPPRKRIFQQNHFSLFIRGPGGFDSGGENAKNLVTLPL